MILWDWLNAVKDAASARLAPVDVVASFCLSRIGLAIIHKADHSSFNSAFGEEY